VEAEERERQEAFEAEKRAIQAAELAKKREAEAAKQALQKKKVTAAQKVLKVLKEISAEVISPLLETWKGFVAIARRMAKKIRGVQGMLAVYPEAQLGTIAMHAFANFCRPQLPAAHEGWILQKVKDKWKNSTWKRRYMVISGSSPSCPKQLRISKSQSEPAKETFEIVGATPLVRNPGFAAIQEGIMEVSLPGDMILQFGCDEMASKHGSPLMADPWISLAILEAWRKSIKDHLHFFSFGKYGPCRVLQPHVSSYQSFADYKKGL